MVQVQLKTKAGNRNRDHDKKRTRQSTARRDASIFFEEGVMDRFEEERRKLGCLM